MRSDSITARNRANAKNSTGPRSVRGKALVSTNARRHGATSRPDPTSVAAWLRVILGKPDLVPRDLLSDARRASLALALAEAEVKLGSARAALDSFERGEVSHSDGVQDLYTDAKKIKSLLWDVETTAKKRRSSLSPLGRVGKVINADTAHGGRRHRLLQRYVREARGHHKRAFQDWLTCLQQQDVQTEDQAYNANLPKQSQIQPIVANRAKNT